MPGIGVQEAILRPAQVAAWPGAAVRGSTQTSAATASSNVATVTVRVNGALSIALLGRVPRPPY
ncbi:hypothetical protein Srufu_011620 [Streptomyces libani subsp. rufus]|nr:hypothetical protein Srufu_011620 [Streptomyces libani subsp. rufus]